MPKLFKAALLIFALAAGAIASGCGGGSNGSVLNPGPAATPQAQSSLQPVTIPASGAVALPAVAGFTPTLNAPPGTTGGAAQAQSFTALPTGLPALSVARRPSSTTSSTFGGTVFLVLALSTTTPITFLSPPSFTIGMPLGFNVTGLQFQAALLLAGSTAWQENALPGVFNASSNTVNYTAAAGGGGPGGYVLPVGTTYLAFYTQPISSSPTPTPSSSPTATPTATPTTAPTATPTTAPTATPTPTSAPTATPTPGSATVSINPTSLAFIATGSGQAQSVTVSEIGYTGTFNQVSNCTGIATIATGPNANQFTITPVAAGTCTATFIDATNSQGQLPITVTTTSVEGH